MNQREVRRLMASLRELAADPLTLDVYDPVNIGELLNQFTQYYRHRTNIGDSNSTLSRRLRDNAGLTLEQAAMVSCYSGAGYFPRLLTFMYAGNVYCAHAFTRGVLTRDRAGDVVLTVPPERRGRANNVRNYSENVLNHCEMKQMEGTRSIDEVGNGAILPIMRYGVELEVEPRGNWEKEPPQIILGRDITDKVLDDLGREHVILKNDASLGEGGFEIVSTPATLDYHKKVLWNKFFDDKEGAWQYLKAYHTGRCGIHVHMSRRALTPMVLGRMLVFYNESTNNKLITTIAGRNNASWAKLAKKNIKDAVTSPFGGDRHVAVNLSKRETVEIRVFRGNVAKAGFFKNLEFVDAVYQFCRGCGNTNPTMEAFLTWIQDPKNGAPYGYLRNFLVTHKFISADKKFNIGTTEGRKKIKRSA